MSKKVKKNIIAGVVLGGLYAIMDYVAKKHMESKDINEDNPYLDSYKNTKMRDMRQITYEKSVKPALDRLISFGGLVLLVPLYAGIAIAIYLDDPGEIFFTQKRIGKDKKFFQLHKFRTMMLSAPHDVPTHQLDNPKQYITRVGEVLRKYSLDELPQLWDIFRGKMSVIGPRPALWNQEDLIAEREKYGANEILPGLTGWAQINGRDELGIPDKAKLDGQYVKYLKQGGVKALFFDMRCFIGTIMSVFHGNGVVEGGTGAIHLKYAIDASDAGFENYGCYKTFNVNKSKNIKVLITGAESYIGESFKKYVAEHYPNITVDTIDMIDGSWREKSFEDYDTVFHVAGIAHVDVGNINAEQQKKYYEVNTDLAIDTAKKAKADRVKQFLFMSSMIIYDDSVPYGNKKIIDEKTVPMPANFYGDSKWQADKGVRKLADSDFAVAVLRPPVIYGKGSKGNYKTLSKIAKRVPFFPNVENERSMLYIENLCEFIAQLICSGEDGIYFPQNREYVKTSTMVNMIGEQAHRPVKITRLFNPLVVIASLIPGKVSGLVNKAFGDSIYDYKLSKYEGLDYQKISLEESIKRTEGADTGINFRNFGSSGDKKPVLILVNHEVVIYNFRLELVERLLADGYEVHISAPQGDRIEELRSLGAICHDIIIDRHGMNPVAELGILIAYWKLVRDINPIIVFGYTIKPNIYGAMVSRVARVPFVANITGLGMAVESGGAKQKLTMFLYKVAFTNNQRVFFQNEENMAFFRKQGIAVSKHALLPGSGVNLDRYPATLLHPCGDGKTGTPVKFAFISRIMKEKGIDQYLDAAESVKERYPVTEFHVCGFCEMEYEGRLEEMNQKGIVIYHGMIKNVADFMSQMHCIVHPTYYPEGLSNVLLESSACGRPIITTDRCGCREVVKNNGFLVPEKNTVELVKAIDRFIKLTYEQKKEMGKAGRKLVEEKFDRRIVVEKYIDEIRIAESLKSKMRYTYE